MSSAFSLSAVISQIAESKGVGSLNNDLIPYVSTICEDYIKDFIQDLTCISLSSKSARITKKHVQMVLNDRGEASLIGYSRTPKYTNESVNHEKYDFIYPDRSIVKLSSMLTPTPPATIKDFQSSFRYICVDGVIIQGLSLNKKTNKDKGRAIDESETVANAVPKPYIEYCVETLNYMRDDTNNSMDIGLSIFRNDKKIQILIPYLIHFITGQMSIHIHDFGDMLFLTKLTLSLVQNPYYEVSIFLHPFLRIALTSLLASDVGSNDTHDDSPVRMEASKIISVLFMNCSSGFPGLGDALYNRFISVIFSQKGSISSHIGAFYGIMALGYLYCERVFPQIDGYSKIVDSFPKLIPFEKALSLAKLKYVIGSFIRFVESQRATLI